MGFPRQGCWSGFVMPSSRGSSWPRGWTQVFYTGGWILYHCTTWEAQEQQELWTIESSWSLSQLFSLKLCNVPVLNARVLGGNSLTISHIWGEGVLPLYLWLIHVFVWRKPTQHCEAIILQLKIKKSCATIKLKFNQETTHGEGMYITCETKSFFKLRDCFLVQIKFLYMYTIIKSDKRAISLGELRGRLQKPQKELRLRNKNGLWHGTLF